MIKRNRWYTGVVEEWDGTIEYAYLLFDGDKSKIMYTEEIEYIENNKYGDTVYVTECSAITHTVTSDYILSILGDSVNNIRYAGMPSFGRRVRYPNS